MPNGYSVWFIPPDGIYEKLATLISSLSAQYATPRFEPHVTLVSRIFLSESKAISRTDRLAKLLHPLLLTSGRICVGDEYFKSLFISVRKTGPLQDANLKARKIFNQPEDPTFSPHLSLMYGKLDTERKEKIFSAGAIRARFQFRTKKVHLVLSSSGMPVTEWRRVREFILT